MKEGLGLLCKFITDITKEHTRLMNNYTMSKFPHLHLRARLRNCVPGTDFTDDLTADLTACNIGNAEAILRAIHY